MANSHFVALIIGLCISVVIYWLVRRDHLAPRQALRWLLVAVTVFVLGLFPEVVDEIGYAVGIAYPPIIPLLVGLGVILVKLLLLDIERNKMNVTQDRIIQKLAMLEADLDDIKHPRLK